MTGCVVVHEHDVCFSGKRFIVWRTVNRGSLCPLIHFAVFAELIARVVFLSERTILGHS